MEIFLILASESRVRRQDTNIAGKGCLLKPVWSQYGSIIFLCLWFYSHWFHLQALRWTDESMFLLDKYVGDSQTKKFHWTFIFTILKLLLRSRYSSMQNKMKLDKLKFSSLNCMLLALAKKSSYFLASSCSMPSKGKFNNLLLTTRMDHKQNYPSTALNSSVVWMWTAFKNLSGFTNVVGTFHLHLAWEVWILILQRAWGSCQG